MNSCSCGDSAPKKARNIEETVKNAYSTIWRNQKKKTNYCSTSNAHDALFERLALRKGMRVLDVGSGSGETVLAIAEKVKPNGKAVGVDFSPDGIALAKEKARKRQLDTVTEFHLANAVNLPFPDNHFDAVISECVICLVPERQKALNEKIRVLKPGGKLVMHDVITNAPMPNAAKENEHLYCTCIGGAVNKEENEKMLQKAGLTNIEAVDFTEEHGKMLNRAILEYALSIEDEQEFQETINFVRKGGVGYALFMGTKPDS